MAARKDEHLRKWLNGRALAHQPKVAVRVRVCAQMT